MATEQQKSVTKRDIERVLGSPAVITSLSPFTYWLRGLARVEGEWLILDVDQSKPYVISEQVVLYHIAGLNLPISHADAIEFAASYGLLRNGIVELQRNGCEQVQFCEESYVTPFRGDYVAARDARTLRESLSDWNKYLALLQDTLHAYHLLKKATAGDYHAIRRLEALLREDQALYLSGQRLRWEFPLSEFRLLTIWSRLIAHSINLGLGGIRPYVVSGVDVSANIDRSCVFADINGYVRDSQDPQNKDWKQFDAPGTFYASGHTRSLIDRAWLDLSHLVTSGKTLNTCDACGCFFDGGREGKKHCSKKCGSRLRQQTKRAKEKEQAS